VTRQRTHSAAGRTVPARGGDTLASLVASVRNNEKLYALSLLLALVFLMGGGSRGDIQSLMYLRPVASLFLAYGLASLTVAQIKANKLLFGIGAAAITLVLLHLVPLPPAIWHAFPGREAIVAIDRAAGLGEPWRPLSMAPYATRNALGALLPPLAVLVIGLQLDSTQLARLVPVVLLLGFFSAFIGLIQVLGDVSSPLYFYNVTQNWLPVGLFANRNHQAVFLATLLPMLLVWARTGAGADKSTRASCLANANLYVALAGGAFLLPLILATGSRSGMALAAFCVAVLPLMLSGIKDASTDRGPDRAMPQPRLGWLRWALPVLGAAIILLSIWLGRAMSFDRLMGENESDMRVLIFPEVMSMIRHYLPWGSGIGSFEAVFALHEPDGLLRRYYMNHAHDDWLEVALTGGVPALAILAATVIWLGLRGWRVIRPSSGMDYHSILLGRAGLSVIVVFALASITDYPLRTPALLCLAVLAAFWTGAASQPRRRPIDYLDKRAKNVGKSQETRSGWVR